MKKRDDPRAFRAFSARLSKGKSASDSGKQRGCFSFIQTVQVPHSPGIVWWDSAAGFRSALEVHEVILKVFPERGRRWRWADVFRSVSASSADFWKDRQRKFSTEIPPPKSSSDIPSRLRNFRRPPTPHLWPSAFQSELFRNFSEFLPCAFTKKTEGLMPR